MPKGRDKSPKPNDTTVPQKKYVFIVSRGDGEASDIERVKDTLKAARRYVLKSQSDERTPPTTKPWIEVRPNKWERGWESLMIDKHWVGH
jgi:hypothetical protein